ncbi:hypothetical protein [Methylobacterium sp. ID0610]|uniref:hypothetical protein n=1 Tax=Methylobacterium carpenticola TaxID=3344827 RepID=UPI0036737A94
MLTAAAWLIDAKSDSERKLLKQAYLKCLLSRTAAGGRWDCDGLLLGRLIEQRMRSGDMPRQGAVLIGIGEMVARSHAPEEAIKAVLCRIFRRSSPESTILTCLTEALDLAQKHTSARQRAVSPIYKSQELSINDWNSLPLADGWMRHPAPVGAFAGYGLGFVTRLLLRGAPDRLRWFAAEADKRQILPAVVGAVGEACCWNEAVACKALQSGVPLFIGFGVARLLHGGEDGEGWKASSVDHMLTTSEVPLAGRVRVSALMLKEMVHAWHRQKDRPYENRRRRVLLRFEPKHAIGGERYAANEIERLAEEEASLEARRAAVMAALDDALHAAAQLDVDPGKLWSVFEPSLVDTPEIRHRFAAAHPEGPIRCAAFEASLAVFDEILGVRRPERICRENFESFRSGRDLALWAAHSQIMLSKANRRDAGHDAARRIGRVEQALRNFVLQPFAASRFGELFQHALERWSLLLQFAFSVALLDSNAPLVRLRDLALQSALSFLPVGDRLCYSHKAVDFVAGLTADALTTASPEDCWKWINDENQPILLRAQIVWSRSDTIGVNCGLGESLIEKVAARETPPGFPGRNGSALFDILDRAAAMIKQDARLDLSPLLAAPYKRAAADINTPLAQSLDLATLLAALNGDADAHRQVREDAIWGQSRLSEVLSR